MENVMTVITQLGFPIFCVLALGGFIWNAYKNILARNESREEKLYGIISDAQNMNQQLSNTNAQFVEILSTYKTDLEGIRIDVAEIKERIK